MKKMAAGSFKANCLAVMDEVKPNTRRSSLRNVASQWRSSSRCIRRPTRFTTSSQARVLLQETLFRPRFLLKNGASSSDSRRYACSRLACV